MKSKKLTFANPKMFKLSESGFKRETLALLSSAIGSFAEGRNDLAPVVKAIRHWQRTASSKEFLLDDWIESLNTGSRRYYATGYLKHGFSVSVIKKDNQYHMSFYDLNVPGKFDWTENYQFVRTITLPDETTLRAIMTGLEKNKKECASSDVAMGFINTIPSVFGTTPFILDKRITMKNDCVFEKNRCYWANLKMSIQDVFMDALGDQKGQETFYKFISFIETKLVDHIEDVFGKRANPKAIQELRSLVASRNTEITLKKKALVIMKTIIIPLLLPGAYAASMILAGPGLGALIFSISLILVLFLYLASNFVSKTFKAPVPITLFAKRTSEEEENAKAPPQNLWSKSSIVAL